MAKKEKGAAKNPPKAKKSAACSVATEPETKVKNPVGRPPMYTKELGERVCKAISTSTDSLATILKQDPDFPCRNVIYEWRWDYPEFEDMYTLAKRRQADLLAEEISEIADDGTNDWMLSNAPNNPGWVINGEAIARSRLRVDTRKWIACKLLPKVYGEKPEPPREEINDNIKVIAEALEALKQKNAKEY